MTPRLALAALAATLLAAPALAQTPAPPPPPGEPVAAPGVTVGGVAVGGLTRDQVAEVVRESVARPLGRRLVVAVGARRFSILPRDAGVSIKLDLLVARAMDSAPGRNVQVVPTLRRSAAPTLLARVRRGVGVAPRNSRVLYSIRRLRASRPRDGRRLDKPAILEDRIAATLRSWTAPRFLRAYTERVRPRIDQRRLRAITGPIVTVSRAGRRARVFNHLRQVRSYPVAVGQPGYPTPTGLFRVRSKAVNPAWSVPNSSWAGSQAGQTVPGGASGNPLVARWIGITSSVGFHGTNNPWSIGSAASHGCIRMYPRDVIKLYVWVRIGTPVYIR
ncbi:MAG TPA: L,D-transpeptidase [Solirubrobacteraceae bacterium]|nr:L,D-transpeptidase [Solirubrobacteraceae bacterium]